ncbi:MAG: sodium-dependent transporter, partial [Chlamydiota bacterium]|nr:sodium-dependent transporter [Chlamydiota bacterium]
MGSAIGLGSLWRFPYVIGEEGGGNFLLIYIIALFVVAIPTALAEMWLGCRYQTDPVGAMAAGGRHPLWRGWGYLLHITGGGVSLFYGIVASRTLSYMVQAACGQLTDISSPEASAA